jgi:hypothetical protein
MGPFTESKVHSDGMKHVEIEGFDREAFETVLHLIHLNHDQIPSTSIWSSWQRFALFATT